MSRAWMWFFLSCKRYAKRISFLLILLILPLAVRGIRTAEKQGETEVRIAVFAEGAEAAEAGLTAAQEREAAASAEAAADIPLEQALAQRLVSETKEDGSLLSFYLCESEQQVKDEVASRRAECGYVIGQGLREKLEQKNFKRSIRVYSAPSTVAAGLSTEVVFAALMELYDKELFVNYVRDGAVFDEAAPAGSPQREQMAEQAAELYETWLYNGSTFHFAAETSQGKIAGGGAPSGNAGEVSSGSAEEVSAGSVRTTTAVERTIARDSSTVQVFPVRGIVAVYIFIIGLYAAVMNLTDERKGLFLAVPYNCRTACRIAAMAAPVVLAAVSGLSALWSGGAAQGAARELPALILYAAAVTAFSWALRVVVKSPEVICCLIPFFLIGSLLFCPVIIDAGRYLPAVQYVRKLFLPWYYLTLWW